MPQHPAATGASTVIWRSLLMSLLGFGIMSSLAIAQIPMMAPPDTLLKGATIYTMSGEVIENGEILISGQKIKAVGRDLLAQSANAERGGGQKPRVVDVSGKVIIPCLIDAASSIGLQTTGGRSAPSQSAVDRVDLFDRDTFQDAIEQGIGFAYLWVAARGQVFGGRGTLLSMSNSPRETGEQAVVSDTEALHVSIGKGGRGSGPIARAMEVKRLADELKTVRKYEEDWDKYKEELETYEKELAEKAKNKKPDSRPTETKPAESGTPAPKPPELPNPGPRPRPRRRGGEVEGPENGTPNPLMEESKDPTAYGRSCPVCGEEGHEGEEHRKLGFDFNEFNDFVFDEPEKPAAAEGTDAAAKKPAGKPQEPAFDPEKEQVLRALNGKIPMRVEVDWAEDILAILKLTAEHPALQVILESVAEGHLVADAIAEAEVPVVVSATPVTPPQEVEQGGNDDFSRLFGRNFPGTPMGFGDSSEAQPLESSANAAILAHKGVKVALGNVGRSAAATPRLFDMASYAAGSGLGRESALAAVTIDAAKVVGASRKLGSIEAGKQASLVILSGKPFDPATRVEQVYVEGRRVFTK